MHEIEQRILHGTLKKFDLHPCLHSFLLTSSTLQVRCPVFASYLRMDNKLWVLNEMHISITGGTNSDLKINLDFLT